MQNFGRGMTAQAAAERAHQYFQETEDDRASRDYAGFSTFEKTLPSMPLRFGGSWADTLSSWLGERNPFAHPVDPQKHSVWLLDNTAWRPEPSSTGREVAWQADLVAAYFIKRSGKDTSKFVADIAEKIGLGKGDAAEALIAKRVQPLLDQILPAHYCSLAIGGNEKDAVRLGPSDRDGLSKTRVIIPGKHKDGEVIASHAVDVHTCTPLMTQFATSQGWAVISDIDDTIKVTMTSSPVGILKSTFAEPFRPIEGMPQLYSYITKNLDNPPYWYLSASPYNLYPFLREFREEHYPAGPLILREASWMNLAGFLTSLTQGTQAYKVDRMEKLHSWFPKRKFLCVGDTTQSDPEAYGEIARKHPGWIGAIFIRKVTGVEGMDEAKKNGDERFDKAFKDLDRSLWYVFSDPQELYAKVDALVKGGL